MISYYKGLIVETNFYNKITITIETELYTL